MDSRSSLSSLVRKDARQLPLHSEAAQNALNRVRPQKVAVPQVVGLCDVGGRQKALEAI